MSAGFACPRCQRPASEVLYATDLDAVCVECVAELRASAAVASALVADRFDPEADHRSPDERRRED